MSSLVVSFLRAMWRDLWGGCPYCGRYFSRKYLGRLDHDTELTQCKFCGKQYLADILGY